MNNTLKFENLKRIVILAAPESRKALIEWSYAHKHPLKHHIIISTARTAGILEGTLHTQVLNLNHGRAGGYHQVKRLIRENHVDMLLVFGDPLKSDKKEPWFTELIEAAVMKDVVVAYNMATINTAVASLSSGPTPSAESDEVQELLRTGIYNQIALS
ncbi:MAG TPA: hypothetical protein VK628_06460 [Flavitalea sp.]|nr:hypothetical protein [Flavitalea sp.]